MYEKDLITELAKKYTAVHTKGKDMKTMRQREDQWRRLIGEFNADPQTTDRDAESIRNCFLNINKKAKKEYAAFRKETFKTGGGPPPVAVSATTSALVDLVPATLQPLEVPDSDQIVMEIGMCSAVF